MSTAAVALNADLLKKHRIQAYATVSRQAVLHNMKIAKSTDEQVYWALILTSWCGPHVREGCYVRDKFGKVISDQDNNPLPLNEDSLLKVLGWPDSKKQQVYKAIRHLKAQGRLEVIDGVWQPVFVPETGSVTDSENDGKITHILGIRIPSHVYEGSRESVTDSLSRFQKIKEKYLNDIKLRLQQARSELLQAFSECDTLFNEETGIEVHVGRSVVETEEPATEPSQTEDLPTDRQKEILEAIPQRLLDKVNDVPTPKLLDETRAKLRSAPPERLTERILQRMDMITSLGALPYLADDAWRAWERAEKARKRTTEAQQSAHVAQSEYELEPKSDRVIDTKKCLKCSGIVEYYESGEICWCKCGPG